MMNFIHKIFQGKIDEIVHLQFQKFSKGEFRNKAVIEVSSSKDKFKISTTAEFSNEFVRAVAEKLKNKTKVSGIVVSTRDLAGQLDFQNKKQFMGVKQYVVDKEMSREEILSLCNKFPTSFIALSFEAEDTSLKIKPKAPKSAKPSTKGEAGPKTGFCKITTKDKELVKDILFDIPLEFDKVRIDHTFLINDIIMPKGEKDFAKIREMAKRKGKIIREIDIDGKKSKSEKDFAA